MFKYEYLIDPKYLIIGKYLWDKYICENNVNNINESYIISKLSIFQYSLSFIFVIHTKKVIILVEY